MNWLDSIKVVLGVGQLPLRIGKLLFGGHSRRLLQWVTSSVSPNPQFQRSIAKVTFIELGILYAYHFKFSKPF